MATNNHPKTLMQMVFEKNQYDLKTAAKKSRAWYAQQVLLLGRQGITANKLMNNPSTMAAKIVPGNMYMFFYDPKLKASLPYYDRFPLVFPYASTPDGFMGLNMHYLPYQLRIQLLDRLMRFKNNDRLDHTTKIKYSWAMIAGVSKYKAAEPCIKRYLSAHVRSPYNKIDSPNWTTAMLLPVEKFVKAPKEFVFKESQNRMAV